MDSSELSVHSLLYCLELYRRQAVSRMVWVLDYSQGDRLGDMVKVDRAMDLGDKVKGLVDDRWELKMGDMDFGLEHMDLKAPYCNHLDLICHSSQI